MTKKDLYYTLDIDADGRVQKIVVNDKEDGERNISMNIYVIERQLLIDQIREAYVNGLTYFERDMTPRNRILFSTSPSITQPSAAITFFAWEPIAYLVVTDKNVTISSYKELKGTESFPVFVEKRKNV